MVRAVAVAVLFAGSMGLVGALAGGGEVEPSAWVSMITSGVDSELSQARDLASAQRQADILALLEIVRSPVGEKEPFFVSSTPRNTAIQILGDMRAKEAVPDLMAWLTPREGQSYKVGALMKFSPAGYALVEIGLPAVPPLMERLKEAGISSAGGSQCLDLLVRIKGADETEFSLGKAIEAETDPVKKANLEAAMAKLKDPEFPVDALERE